MHQRLFLHELKKRCNGWKSECIIVVLHTLIASIMCTGQSPQDHPPASGGKNRTNTVCNFPHLIETRNTNMFYDRPLQESHFLAR